MSGALHRRTFAVEAGTYDLGSTLDSGQAFRWNSNGDAWEGVIGRRWVRLTGKRSAITAECVVDPGNWEWLETYLGLEHELAAILATFPDDPPMRAAMNACRGLRLLRQDPWECLASFILSSTKQIIQIRQIVRTLCCRFGERVATPPQREPEFAFPEPTALAQSSEAELRACKMGFRAPYLLATARAVADGHLDLDALRRLSLEQARKCLMELPGVGRKIADCVLLFAYGFPAAFPVDVWVMRGLRELYFARRRTKPAQILAFSQTYFGAHGGYAQQYLFHYMRARAGRISVGTRLSKASRT